MISHRAITRRRALLAAGRMKAPCKFVDPKATDGGISRASSCVLEPAAPRRTVIPATLECPREREDAPRDTDRGRTHRALIVLALRQVLV
jgi:hypothetical protein